MVDDWNDEDCIMVLSWYICFFPVHDNTISTGKRDPIITIIRAVIDIVDGV